MLFVKSLIEQGRVDDAVQELNKRIQKDPDESQNYISLAQCYSIKGKNNTAMRTLIDGLAQSGNPKLIHETLLLGLKD